MFIKTEKVNSIYTDDTWRAVCGESRTHGSEEGNGKSTWNEKVTRLLPILHYRRKRTRPCPSQPRANRARCLRRNRLNRLQLRQEARLRNRTRPLGQLHARQP